MNATLDIYKTEAHWSGNESEWFVDDITNTRTTIGKVFKWNNKWFYQLSGQDTYSEQLFTTKKSAIESLLVATGVK